MLRNINKPQRKNEKSRIEYFTFGVAGIETASMSGSPFGSEEEPPAAFRCFNKPKVRRATRNPRINTH